MGSLRNLKKTFTEVISKRVNISESEKETCDITSEREKIIIEGMERTIKILNPSVFDVWRSIRGTISRTVQAYKQQVING